MRRSPRERADWEAVDWREQDINIARELGVSRERVRQQRAKRGQPKALSSYERRLRTLINLDTSDMTIAEVAEHLGVAHHTARKGLNDIGRKAGDGYRTAYPTGLRAHTWKHDWNSVDWERQTDAEIAEQLGCSRPTVTTTRRRWNKPRCCDRRGRPRKKETQ